jgi:hypothetical protein
MATITIKTRYIIIAVFALFLGVFLLGGYIGHSRAESASKASVDALNKEIVKYSMELEKKTVYVSQIEQELKTLRQAKQDGDVTSQDLRKLNIKTLNELTKTKLTLKVVRDSVKHNGKIITIHDTILKDVKCIELPFSFADSSQYVNLWGEFSTEGVMNWGINAPVNIDLYSTVDKTTKKNSVSVVIDNPYVTVNSVSSIKLDIPKVKKWGIGVQVGYGISIAKKPTMFPYIGFGVSRNFIRF